MATDEQGVAYKLWERIDREMYERKLTQKWLVERSGVSAMTINRLRTQRNLPKAETVHALAEALGIDRDEAGVLAGRLRPQGDEQISVRDAVLRSDAYSDAEKRTILGVIDALDAANRAQRTAAQSTEPDDTRRAI